MNNIEKLKKGRIQLLFGGIYELFKKSKVDIRELYQPLDDCSGTHTLATTSNHKKRIFEKGCRKN